MFNNSNIRHDLKLFKEFNKIIEYNNKYKVKIKYDNEGKLDLNEKYIDNEGLKDLYKINFKQVQILNLSHNKISDIKVLESVNFKELQTLDVSWNQLSDIKVFQI